MNFININLTINKNPMEDTGHLNVKKVIKRRLSIADDDPFRSLFMKKAKQSSSSG
jgi:hypothetical protein